MFWYNIFSQVQDILLEANRFTLRKYRDLPPTLNTAKRNLKTINMFLQILMQFSKKILFHTHKFQAHYLRKQMNDLIKNQDYATIKKLQTKHYTILSFVLDPCEILSSGKQVDWGILRTAKPWKWMSSSPVRVYNYWILTCLCL